MQFSFINLIAGFGACIWDSIAYLSLLQRNERRLKISHDLYSYRYPTPVQMPQLTVPKDCSPSQTHPAKTHSWSNILTSWWPCTKVTRRWTNDTTRVSKIVSYICFIKENFIRRRQYVRKYQVINVHMLTSLEHEIAKSQRGHSLSIRWEKSFSEVDYLTVLTCLVFWRYEHFIHCYCYRTVTKVTNIQPYGLFCWSKSS